MCLISYIHYICILNLVFDDDTQTRMKTRGLTLREKQAIWMLKEKSKPIKTIVKTKSMEKSRVWKPPETPATNKSSQVKLSFIVIPLHVWPYSGTRCRVSQDHGAT